MDVSVRKTAFGLCLLGLVLVAGCQGSGPRSACDNHSDCEGDTYCGERDGEDVCLKGECEPGSARCEDGAVVRCNDAGSAFLDPVDCETGDCESGSCVCRGDGDCGPGESCVRGSCECPSEIRCGDDGTCCGDQEACRASDVCDGPDDCEEVAACRPTCDGEFCGSEGDVCCGGETPTCGPTGDCAPDCSDAGDLCGETFDMCCESGDICSFGACVTPGADCESFADCGFGEYCDRALNQCMPDNFPEDLQCRRDGDFGDLEVEQKWSWAREDIISVPVVGDVTGNGEPNVVVNASRTNGGNWPIGTIFILDSAGQQLERIEHDPDRQSWGSHGRSNIALGDVTGDGSMEIVYASRPIRGGESYIVAAEVDGDGTAQTLWRARDTSGEAVRTPVHNGAVTVADFDDDGTRAEIVVGAMLIDHDGRVQWHEEADGAPFGTNSGYNGGVPVVADLDDSGDPEIVTGKHAWSIDWESTASGPEVTGEAFWTHDGPDGYPAVADMDGDTVPEVVLVADSTLRVLEGETGNLWCSFENCSGDDDSTGVVDLPGDSNRNRGGPPTVADFDGDGRPEIGVAGGHYYTVFDVNRPSFGGDDSLETVDEQLLDAFGVPEPEIGQLYVRWKRETQDLSSNATGSSVFDFQGDGSASVVYADECAMRAYSGVDGEFQVEIPNSTGTILEYPIVVDVDENGRSELLVVANAAERDCSEIIDGFELRQGLYVYEDPEEKWVHTRSIWNQHAYAIDNVGDDGSVPEQPPRWWERHNTFRANRQGEVPLNAPDVVVSSVQVNKAACPPTLQLRATVENRGKSAIPAGLPVSLYREGERIETILVDDVISPGGLKIVEFSREISTREVNRGYQYRIVANDTDAGMGTLSEDCQPEDAEHLLEDVECRLGQ